jgi:hypothetical protein
VIARIAFRYNDTRLFSRVVCLLRGGDSAHCEVAIEQSDGTHWCVSSSFLDGGVRGKDMPLPADKWRVYEIDAQRDPAAWEVEHAGKGYDILGLLGVAFPPFGHSRRRWFCSEAAADMLGLREPHIYDLRTLESVCARFGTRVQ